MFEIVRESGAIRGVVFTASAHGNFRIESWLFMVFRQINLKAVVQLEYLCIQWVVRISFVNSVVAKGLSYSGFRLRLHYTGSIAAGNYNEDGHRR